MSVSGHDWLRTALCTAAGCDHEAYASRGRHAPNCLQDDVNLVLDELEAENDRLRKMSNLNPDIARIALRPDVRGEDPTDVSTALDDIVVQDVSMFRAEQMSSRNWWVACYLRGEELHNRICWSVSFKSGKLRWVTTELADGVSYEHGRSTERGF